jgi:hypothetical protein
MEVIMRPVAIVLMLAAAVAFPAAGDAASKKKPRIRHSEPAYSQRFNPGSYEGHLPVRTHSSNPQWDVYRPNGDYAGSDPDPFIRSMLRRDDTTNDP